MSTKTPATTARKVVGSLGVIGAAAAVAGLGTFGTFTDSTTPVTTQVTAGSVEINLDAAGAPIPVTTADFVPGDSMSRAVTLSNDGDSALDWVNLAVTSTGESNVLTTDPFNGLRLSLESCSQAWTQGGTAEAPTYTCEGTISDLGTGPVVTSRRLTDAASLTPGGEDHLVFTISLPTGADNTFQDKSATLSLQFSTAQRPGTTR